ncbi:MAG: sensor histidine kinase [Ignavibacteriales bacterium]|nr:sensor histidine kinase [Ignavibacteriales bacterium]
MSSDQSIILTAIFSVTAVVLGLFLFFVVMMVRSHRKIEAAQRERLRQMQLFSEKLQAAREEEQKQIARELHDELGGALTGIKYDLLWLGKHTVMKSSVKERYQAIRTMVDTTTKTVQRISSGLRPKILDTVGLAAAVEWHIREFTKRTSIEVKLQQPDNLPSLDDAKTTGVYRIIQEALTNIARHSEATRAEVAMHLNNGELRVAITDNGKGIDQAMIVHPESLGILSMQERARMLGGKIAFTSNPGKGTCVVLSVQIHDGSQSKAAMVEKEGGHSL